MQNTTKAGAGLIAAGAGAALVAVESADHGAATLAVAGGILSGALTALGATSIIIGWTTRRPATGQREKV